MANNKDTKVLLDDLEKQGFTYLLPRSGHYKIYGPDGGYVTTMSQTPSDVRSRLNTLSRLRQAGYRPSGEERQRPKEKRYATTHG